MGLIRTMGQFCNVECDTRNCNKKMEHVDERLLRQLAGLCGWENRDHQWTCPRTSADLVDADDGAIPRGPQRLLDLASGRSLPRCHVILYTTVRKSSRPDRR